MKYCSGVAMNEISRNVRSGKMKKSRLNGTHAREER